MTLASRVRAGAAALHHFAWKAARRRASSRATGRASSRAPGHPPGPYSGRAQAVRPAPTRPSIRPQTHAPPVSDREVIVMTVPPREEIVAQLAEILHEVAGVVPAEVTEEKSLVEELDVDSLAMAEVIVVAEERFGIALPEEEMKDMRRVLDIVLRVEKQLAS
ncbi:acyl carrier protein [Streptomyces sp. NPDC048197]|uniref:acyl carrier protein n=2 Tax=Streptomyces TaxID=1883 RepID=UPI003710209E